MILSERYKRLLALTAIAEIERQSNQGKPGPYIYQNDDPRHVGIDGEVDMVAVATAVATRIMRLVPHGKLVI